MSPPDSRKQERFWSQLLDVVSKGDSVPVVGEELLHLDSEPNGTTLYQELARRFATEYGIQLEKGLNSSLSATVRRHPDFFNKSNSIYQGVADDYEALNPPVPETLRALARIRHFNLFVTTTFDDLLERALNEERFQGQPRTEVISFAPNKVPVDKVVEDALRSGRPVVLQFFGNRKAWDQYALTEVDMVEYVHSLEANQKQRFITALYDRPVLLLGNSFPDWLTRILLRLFRNKPLHIGGHKSVYVADAQAASDPRLKFFLQNFVVNTEVIEESLFTGGSAELPITKPSVEFVHELARRFVQELSRRWIERFGAAGANVVPVPSVKSKPMPRKAVFISYCRSDLMGGPTPDTKTALAIRDGLEARGVDVWLDKDQLRGGNDYESKIKRYIETSSLFVPIISETTDAREDSFFRKEWRWALDRLSYFTGAQRDFVVPVLIGPEDWKPRKVPEEFKRTHYVRLPNGEPDVGFLDHVRSLYEEVRGNN